MEKWHIKDVQEVEKILETSIVTGLTQDEAEVRLEKYGPNKLEETKKKTPLVILFDQFKDFMILILILAAIISGLIGEPIDTIAIIVIVILNAVIGFIQEYRAERAMEALKEMASPSATVIRDSQPSNIEAIKVVSGDMVSLEAGNVVPADIRLTDVAQLRVNESTLTGESVPIEKNASLMHDPMLSIGDRLNLVYKGTIITYGRAKGIVVGTGMDTELGSIATLLQKEEEVKTPLQKRLAHLGQLLSIIFLIICTIVFGVGVLQGDPPIEMFLVAISLAVAAIPEALPAVVTITLSLGAKKMVQQNALIRKLPAVETLGSITYICSDKTGTLTLNKMTVEEVFVDGKILTAHEVNHLDINNREQKTKPLSLFLQALSLNNDAKIDKDKNILGDPTETALFEFSMKNGYYQKDVEVDFPRVAEIPFDSERKLMTTFHKSEKAFLSITKGAPESMLGKSKDVFTSRGIVPINENVLQEANQKMASDGLRVLAIAMRKWEKIPDSMSSENVENNLTIVGLVGMLDPPREEAKEAVAQCKHAGIIPVMITGDHPLTAKTIAKRLNILDDDKDTIITGSQLDSLSLEEFEKIVEHIRVYARVAPEQKLKIVKALQDKHQFACMTGDGVNDAPSLKRADIGVAMGITGTDVAKEASHMILLDDNFATIVKAVSEGRRIYDNIRKFIKYVLSCNTGEILTIFVALILGLPVPLLPIQILWINLVTDGLPGLALAAERADENIMERPPRHPKESVFSHGLGYDIFWIGSLMAGVCIFTQVWALNNNFPEWQTMVFIVLTLSQMGNVMAVRSDAKSLFKLGLFSNMSLIGAFILTFILQMAIIYIPLFNPVFKTVPLSLEKLLITLLLSTIVFIAVEIVKHFRIKKSR